MTRICASALAVLTAPARLWARDLPSPRAPTRTRSRSIKSFKCSFPVYTVGAWKTGEPQAQIKQADQFTLDDR